MSEKRIKKRVLITGCSSGFGLLMAVEAAKAGFDCIATMRNMEKTGSLNAALHQADVNATIDRLDVTQPGEIEAIVAKYGPFDILINNSGILTMGSFLDITEAEMREVFEINYFGAVALTRAVAPAMIAQRSGLIINITSLAGVVGHMFNAAYSASKHALIGFSQSTRMELKPFNIKVVSVEPGYHKTEIIRRNANISENFYDRQSPMFEQNRGFLRLMFDEVIPRAGEPGVVADKVVEIMQAKHPRPHYTIGKDAMWATIATKLGLGGLLEKKVCQKLARTTRRENRKDQNRKDKRKNRVASGQRIADSE